MSGLLVVLLSSQKKKKMENKNKKKRRGLGLVLFLTKCRKVVLFLKENSQEWE